MKKNLRLAFTVVSSSIALFGLAQVATASIFPKPADNVAIIGDVQYAPAPQGDTVPLFAHRYDLGINEIASANPQINPNAILNSNTLEIPTKFMLPPLPRKGIVINLPEMRMYYYPEGSNTMMTFPIGIGRIGKTIPIQNTVVVRKVTNPTWTPTASIREYNKEQGINLPKTIGPGPDNPLGPYAIYMRIPTYLIHSTIFPESIGRRASFGCIRMNENDIKDLYPLIKPGTPVTIVNMPTKVAWQNNALYLEAHKPLEEHSKEENSTLNGMVQTVENATHGKLAIVNWQLIAYLSQTRDGVPHQVGVKIS